MDNRPRRNVLREAWALARPYFSSEEKWQARGLLAAIIGLNLATVYINVRLNTWRGDFYNALQQYDAHDFSVQIGIFSLLAGLFIVIAVYQLYLTQMLEIRWRRWLTHRFLGAWLDHQTYYRMQLVGTGTDNPDQRISDDLRLFTSQTLGLSIGLLNAVVTLGSFLFILWELSGSLVVPLGAWGTLTIPGYMLWAAVIYAGFGTWITRKIGWPLVRLNFNQQRYEADFRFSLVRLRENAESVAFYGGEAREGATFRERFGSVFTNFWSIMRRQKQLAWFTNGYGQAAVVFPYLMAAPRYFSKEIQLGGLMQIAAAFDQVQTSLSFIINSYPDIASWHAVVDRLAGFSFRTRRVAEQSRQPQPIVIRRDGAGLAVPDLDLDLPDGRPLRQDIAFDVAPGGALLVTGPSGSGKSTMLRAIAGLWPFGSGEVRLDPGRALFLPQRPYIPLGSLRNALCYPDAGEGVPAGRLADVLDRVGLGRLADQLETVDNWAQRLSLGEQQRLAFARILLAEPRTVFLDEATSALDEPSEARLYALLREAPWRPTLVSVGHRSTLRPFHDDLVDFGAASVPATAAE